MAQVFSFKLRGAYNKMAKLPKDVLQRGVITSSAGNHAQGVALAASRLVSYPKLGTAVLPALTHLVPSYHADNSSTACVYTSTVCAEKLRNNNSPTNLLACTRPAGLPRHHLHAGHHTRHQSVECAALGGCGGAGRRDVPGGTGTCAQEGGNRGAGIRCTV